MNYGLDKAKLQALCQEKDRLTFLYVERCAVNRQDGAITVTDMRGTVHVPAAMLSVLMIGPGTSVTHRAVELIGNSGMTVIWVGEQGVRYYAHGSPLTHSAVLLKKQAELVSNKRMRLAVARRMYQMRFPNEDVSLYTMQQLRGREGARIREVYRKISKDTEVKWNGREYDPNEFTASDDINMALSCAHACLYGIAHSAIVALGCSPGLGFVHDGHERSFVYDVADLYKADITIPIAFEVIAEKSKDIPADVRRRIRDAAFDSRILERTVRDIRCLLLDESADTETADVQVLYLWDEKKGCVANGISYGKMEDEQDREVGYGVLLES